MNQPFEFTSKECKDRSHISCAGHWLGLGIEAVCICKCRHIKNYTVLEEAFRGSTSKTEKSSQSTSLIIRDNKE